MPVYSGIGCLEAKQFRNIIGATVKTSRGFFTEAAVRTYTRDSLAVRRYFFQHSCADLLDLGPQRQVSFDTKKLGSFSSPLSEAMLGLNCRLILRRSCKVFHHHYPWLRHQHADGERHICWIFQLLIIISLR